ncbi:hypothetical protein GCM10010469_63090 [Streptomyces labedae]|uniref:Secreted protein n=2 Tax=Streptomyces TaxID=1883 RepID=A0ABQ2U1Z6_9ACTN|nr:hypothetical protein GCM10010265_50340 [Streptomyces griseoincarnatus]GGT62156.1 hypothetical protein GCM10010287_41010 [Streptomyces variabilis]
MAVPAVARPPAAIPMAVVTLTSVFIRTRIPFPSVEVRWAEPVAAGSASRLLGRHDASPQLTQK